MSSAIATPMLLKPRAPSDNGSKGSARSRSTRSSLASTPTQVKLIERLESAERWAEERHAQREARRDFSATGKLRHIEPTHKPLKPLKPSMGLIDLSRYHAANNATLLPVSKNTTPRGLPALNNDVVKGFYPESWAPATPPLEPRPDSGKGAPRHVQARVIYPMDKRKLL